MNHKLKKLVTNWRILILLFFLVVSVIAIHPNLNKGVAIRSVGTNSSASIAGIPQPKPNILPVSRERILAINNIPVNNVNDFYKYTSTLSPNKSIQIKTSNNVYKIVTQEKFETVVLNETEEKNITQIIQRKKSSAGIPISAAMIK